MKDRLHAGGNANMPSFASIESASGISADQIEEMEEYVRKALDQDTGTITAYRVLHMYLERLSVDFQVPTPFCITLFSYGHLQTKHSSQYLSAGLSQGLPEIDSWVAEDVDD